MKPSRKLPKNRGASSSSPDPNKGILEELPPMAVGRLFAVSTLLAAGLFVAASILVVQLVKEPLLQTTWQVYTSIGVWLLAVLLTVVAAWSIRPGPEVRAASYRLALRLLLIAIALMAVPTFLVSKHSIPVGIIIIVIMIFLAIQVLPRRLTNLGLIGGLLFGSLVILGGLYPLPWQIILPGEGQIPLIGAVVIALFATVSIFRRFRDLALAVKFGLVFLLTAVAGSALIAYFTADATRQALSKGVGESARNVADLNAQAIGDLLQQQVDALTSLAIGDRLQSWVISANRSYVGDEASIQARIKSLDDEWLQASALGDVNNALVRTRLENPIASDLSEFSDTFPAHAELLLTDRYGSLIAASNLTTDYFQADEDWWRTAYQFGSGGLYISPQPGYDESAGIYSLRIAIPVRDRETQEVIGVLGTTYDIDQIFRLLGDVRLGETGEVDLFFPGLTPLHLHAGALSPVPGEEFEQLNVLRDFSYVEIDYEGVPSLVSQRLVHTSAGNPRIAGLGWVAVARQATAEAYAPVDAQSRFTLIIVLGIVNLLALAAVFLAQFLTAPIQRLTAAAEGVRSGDLSVSSPVVSGDEIGRLADTFNNMTAQLRQTLRRLESSVAERTRELTLAGEVGRALTQERDQERLLQRAVELIRSRFDLYYVQIYLADSAVRILSLRAGSGSVGAELQRRGHRLPVGLGSLNGVAAAERRTIIVEDTSANPTFRPNPLLPETRSELCTPLLLGNRVLGVLDLQSKTPAGFSEGSLPAMQALASQLAVAIENAALFSQAQEARDEMERQASRLVRRGWGEFLDGIERSERIGYSLEDGEVDLSEPAVLAITQKMDTSELVVPIQVSGETVGHIRLVPPAGREWGQADARLVETIAGQLARHADSLRLIDRAESYRQQAEVAARRLTRQGWQEYMQSAEFAEQSYLYEAGEVLPEDIVAIPASSEPGDSEEYVGTLSRLSVPLTVRGAAIGEIYIDAPAELSDEARSEVDVIAERLAEHLDNLRLAAQTQAALADTENLYAGSETIVRSTNIRDVLSAVVQTGGLDGFDRARILLFDHAWETVMPDTALVVAIWNRPGVQIPSSTTSSQQYSLNAFPAVRLLQRDQPFLVLDVSTDRRLDEQERQVASALGSALVIFPMVAGELWIGLLVLSADQPLPLSDAQIRQAMSLVGQASAVVQALHLLEETQLRARREQTLRQFAERVRSAVDAETVLRSAAREVGSLLGRKVMIHLSPVGSAVDDGGGVVSGPGVIPTPKGDHSETQSLDERAPGQSGVNGG